MVPLDESHAIASPIPTPVEIAEHPEAVLDIVQAKVT